MLTAETLKAIQIEISSNCNAGCLDCLLYTSDAADE